MNASTAPCPNLGKIFWLDVAIAIGVPDHGIIVDLVQCLTALRDDHRLHLAEVVRDFLQFHGLITGHRITNHRDLWIVPIHPVEEPVQIRIVEIVVEEEQRERHVRIPVDLVGAVLANARCIAEPPGIGDTGMTASIGHVFGLLCVLNGGQPFVRVVV